MGVLDRAYVMYDSNRRLIQPVDYTIGMIKMLLGLTAVVLQIVLYVKYYKYLYVMSLGIAFGLFVMGTGAFAKHYSKPGANVISMIMAIVTVAVACPAIIGVCIHRIVSIDENNEYGICPPGYCNYVEEYPGILGMEIAMLVIGVLEMILDFIYICLLCCCIEVKHSFIEEGKVVEEQSVVTVHGPDTPTQPYISTVSSNVSMDIDI